MAEVAADVQAVIAFLSIQAQDFIEELRSTAPVATTKSFLSIQAQDFIEDATFAMFGGCFRIIPEHSSSGLH